jgi:hypothetical protein
MQKGGTLDKKEKVKENCIIVLWAVLLNFSGKKLL